MDELTKNDKIGGILGIFQKLNASKETDQYGFDILETIYDHADREYMKKHDSAIFTLILCRIQSEKTVKYIRSFIIFISKFIIKNSVQFFISIIENVQANIFLDLLQNVIIYYCYTIKTLLDIKSLFKKSRYIS